MLEIIIKLKGLKIKGTVSRNERGMLLYIFRKLFENAIASEEKT